MYHTQMQRFFPVLLGADVRVPNSKSRLESTNPHTHGTDMNSEGTTNKQTVLITTTHNGIVYFIPRTRKLYRDTQVGGR